MFEKIDKLQSEVDDLLDLCADAGGVADLEAFALEDQKQQRLGTMILQMQDGVLERRYVHRFEQWLLCDRRALRYYIDFQQLSAALYCHYNKSRFTRMLDRIKGALSVLS